MKYYYLVFALFLIAGCAKEALELTDPGLFDGSDGELSARIDGRRFQANAAFALHEDANITDSLSVLQLIGGDIRNEDNGEAIVLYLFLGQDDLPAAGSYTMDGDCKWPYGDCLGGAYGLSLGNGDIQQTFLAEVDDPGAAASLSYTTYEKDGRAAIRGTFSMRLISEEDGTTTMEITNGEFDILLSET
jgi:hypothetical protein